MENFIRIFKKVEGKKILEQYWRAHVLVYAVVQTVILGFSKKSLEIVRLSVDNKIVKKLRRKYKSYVDEYRKNETKNLIRQQSNYVWVCWLQGIENAPDLVQKCYSSILENIDNREIVLLTEENYRNYVQFPSYIQKKIDSGIITRTHMSDLLRLELLIRYGGTWIDATVYFSDKNYPKYMFESDLFVFQCLKPGLDGHASCISSWFMSACTNHPILLLTRALLYEYWKTEKYMIDYFLLHDFFQIAIEQYPEEWKKVVPFCNSVPHILLLRMFEKYDKVLWEAMKEMTCIHKLTYKFELSEKDEVNTFYDVLLIND